MSEDRYTFRHRAIRNLLLLARCFFKLALGSHAFLLYLYRNAIRARLTADGIIGQNAYVVIAGPANTYAHYVTTIEEYGVQRYEGASTLFGPCKNHSFFGFGSNEIRLFILVMFADTLDAYIDKYSSLVSYLADNATAGAVPPSDPAPPDLTSRAISLRVRPWLFAFSNRMLLLLTLMIARRLTKDRCRVRQCRYRSPLRGQASRCTCRVDVQSRPNSHSPIRWG